MLEINGRRNTKRNLRRDAKAILMVQLSPRRIPLAAVEQVLRAREDLDRYERIFVVGAGVRPPRGTDGARG